MGTLMDKLNAINASKEQIRQAIERKKASVPENTPLKDYPAKIDGIYPDALFLGEMNLGSPLPMGAVWQTMTSGDGKIILAGRDGDIATDKIVLGTKKGWQVVTLPQAEKWDRSCFGGGNFVICGNMFSKIVYSNDGLNWKIANNPLNTPITSIIYGNGFFVAGTSEKGFIYSSDGSTWTETPGQIIDYMSRTVAHMAFAFDYFFALYSDGVVYKSKDLKTWTLVQIPWNTDNAVAFGLAYSDGILAALIRDGSTKYFAWMKDGTNWSYTNNVVFDYTRINHFTAIRGTFLWYNYGNTNEGWMMYKFKNGTHGLEYVQIGHNFKNEYIQHPTLFREALGVVLSVGAGTNYEVTNNIAYSYDLFGWHNSIDACIEDRHGNNVTGDVFDKLNMIDGIALKQAYQAGVNSI